jgi:hypothetical protein
MGVNMKIKLSKSQWERIGRVAGWTRSLPSYELTLYIVPDEYQSFASAFRLEPEINSYIQDANGNTIPDPEDPDNATQAVKVRVEYECEEYEAPSMAGPGDPGGCHVIDVLLENGESVKKKCQNIMDRLDALAEEDAVSGWEPDRLDDLPPLD